jgi:hypothetical protein
VNGTETVITSAVSKGFPIADAGPRRVYRELSHGRGTRDYYAEECVLTYTRVNTRVS